MKHVAIIKELEDHISAIPEGTLGELLKSCKRMIENQADDLAEKRDMIKALQASETMRIEQLKKAREELEKFKRPVRNQYKQLNEG